MYKKILVANRGEIAVRVIRTLKKMGIRSVAVYSDVDQDAMHASLADEAFRLGPPNPAESYLNQNAIIEIARRSGAEAIHPGYGFLAENSSFVSLCEENGIEFIGPSSKTLQLTGNKSRCREIAASEGVPVSPGSKGTVSDVEEALGVAEKVGYPVMLKSAFGGGGLGIREVRNSSELRASWEIAIGEAKNAFGRASLYIEKLVKPARHIEVQVLADKHGNIIHLGERECSIQRRHQKLIEMTPSPAVDEKTREKIGEYAVRIARAVGYRNAGTVEFLRGSQGNFYFMEVNSRLQVEHPITEEVTGLDIVKEQVRIAMGEELPLSQKDVVRRGAAIEIRINAEDPINNFSPDSGKVMDLRLPGGRGIRVDTALYPGFSVPEYYDSLVVKLIARGEDLEEARRAILSALEETVIKGIKTNIIFHKVVLESQEFASWNLSTDFIEENRIIERIKRRAEEERRGKALIGAVILSSMLSRGVHKTVTSTKVEQGQRRVTSRGRFYDAI